MRAIEKTNRVSAAITLLGILTVVTPLCGLLFDCGCTWPWLGLAEHCNYFDPLERQPCPFCDRTALSIPLLIFATLAGLVVGQFGISRTIGIKRSILIDSLGGLLVFVGLTALGGSLF